MALKATIFKVQLQVSDMDRGYYGSHALTVARHPSETDERMMMRVLAFALFAGEALEFGRGLSTDDEADLLERDATGQILRWIDVGLPDERDIRKACARAHEVTVIAYGRTVQSWWDRNRGKLETLENLAVLALPPDSTAVLAGLAARGMEMQCTIQDELVWITSGNSTLEVEPIRLKTSRAA
ncbi:hypothetical protein B1C78_13280 [Thioalkalivibrio denitrificans]|uniref:YaeQ family protein n=1 Tax=Thioalkalivibrio denitrificans TaxID=108003 RepID=A0A1V3NDH0_9GAMM|nr:YaeQ family protein [Thioalkalivibrio denitrificans]OOG22912.1 hypothetical protein B1C78_13280 [Thioalkalivibrio denitrificans]